MSIQVVTTDSILADLEAGTLAATVITHDGPRHADEVLALARLAAGTSGAMRVCFTRDPRVLGLRNAPSLTFVDIGGSYAPGEGRFDHHFLPTPRRNQAAYNTAAAALADAEGDLALAEGILVDGDDGGDEYLAAAQRAIAVAKTALAAAEITSLPLSSFGMVTLIDHPDEVDHDLVRHIDAIDNGVKGEPAPEWWPCLNPADNGGSVAWAVHHANPVNLDGSAVTDEQFTARAVELIELFVPLFGWDGALRGYKDCRAAIEDRIKRALSVWHADNAAATLASVKRVEAALAGYNNDPVLVLDQYEVAALDKLAVQPETGPMYVVFPGPGGRQWMCQQVAKAPGSFEGRKPLPEAWAGLRDEAFQQATGVSDGVFCHPGRFIGGAVSREGACRLARLAVEA